MKISRRQWMMLTGSAAFASKIVDGKIKVPKTPGMGLDIDPDYLKQATVLMRVNNKK